jgi:hypothetical protein
MIRSKLGLLGLCAMVLGVMAISASSAQAAKSWLVGTTEITANGPGVNLLAEVVGEIDTPEPKLLFHLIGFTVTVTCTNVTTSNIHFGANATLAPGGKVIFTGCTAVIKDRNGSIGPPCTVKSTGQPNGTIASEKLKGEAVLHQLEGEKKDVLAKIEPEIAGGSLTTIKFEGAECLLSLSNPLTGVVFVKDCEGFAETLKVKHLVEEGPLTSISLGSDTAEHLESSIDGSGWVKLTGAEHTGKEWRAMEI